MQSETPLECQAPCIDLESLIELSTTPENATLFAEADIACGTPVQSLLTTVRFYFTGVLSRARSRARVLQRRRGISTGLASPGECLWRVSHAYVRACSMQCAAACGCGCRAALQHAVPCVSAACRAPPLATAAAVRLCREKKESMPCRASLQHAVRHRLRLRLSCGCHARTVATSAAQEKAAPPCAGLRRVFLGRPSGMFVRAITERQQQLCVQAFGACFLDADVLAGCDCRSGAACGQALEAAITPGCKNAIIQTSCDNAFWFDEMVGINVRNLYDHILNDCLRGPPVRCDASVRSPLATLSLLVAAACTTAFSTTACAPRPSDATPSCAVLACCFLR